MLKLTLRSNLLPTPLKFTDETNFTQSLPAISYRQIPYQQNVPHFIDMRGIGVDGGEQSV